jgi:hypothetical protein
LFPLQEGGTSISAGCTDRSLQLSKIQPHYVAGITGVDDDIPRTKIGMGRHYTAAERAPEGALQLGVVHRSRSMGRSVGPGTETLNRLAKGPPFEKNAPASMAVVDVVPVIE